MNGAESARRDLVVRLRRVEGQLRGVQRLIEEGADCDVIAQQLAASRKALDKTFFELLACAIEHPQIASDQKESRDERMHRVARTLAKFG
jgi:CsoR family transcriptional regulator, copper-sensing transcriptional repressor